MGMATHMFTWLESCLECWRLPRVSEPAWVPCLCVFVTCVILRFNSGAIPADGQHDPFLIIFLNNSLNFVAWCPVLTFAIKWIIGVISVFFFKINSINPVCHLCLGCFVVRNWSLTQGFCKFGCNSLGHFFFCFSFCVRDSSSELTWTGEIHSRTRAWVYHLNLNQSWLNFKLCWL